MTNKEQMEWAKEVPFLAAMPKKNPFVVPERYFEAATDNIKITAAIGSYSNADKGFTVPEGYFTDLKSNILASISLQSFKEENAGFALPEGYFSKLSESIIAKTSIPVKKEVKILKLWSSDLIKYATAACFILIAATTLYIQQQKTPVMDNARMTELHNEQILYDIDEDVIVEQLQIELTTSNTSKASNSVEEYLLNHYSATDLAQEL